MASPFFFSLCRSIHGLSPAYFWLIPIISAWIVHLLSFSFLILVPITPNQCHRDNACARRAPIRLMWPFQLVLLFQKYVFWSIVQLKNIFNSNARLWNVNKKSKMCHVDTSVEPDWNDLHNSHNTICIMVNVKWIKCNG